METEGARVPPHLYLLGVFMGIWKSEVWEKKVSLFTVKNHILISNRKTRIRGYLSSTLSASHMAELKGAICGAAYDFVNFIIPHPLPNSLPCGLQIVPLKNKMCSFSYEI